MPVRVNEFVIQAKVEEENNLSEKEAPVTYDDLMALKNEIMAECLEKFEQLLQKKEGR